MNKVLIFINVFFFACFSINIIVTIGVRSRIKPCLYHSTLESIKSSTLNKILDLTNHPFKWLKTYFFTHHKHFFNSIQKTFTSFTVQTFLMFLDTWSFVVVKLCQNTGTQSSLGGHKCFNVNKSLAESRLDQRFYQVLRQQHQLPKM